MSKLSIAELLAKKERKTIQTATVTVPGLGGEIELKKLPLAEYVDLNGAISDARDGQEFMRAAVEEIYAFCPILHAKELQEGCGCKVPTDVVGKLLGDDIADYMAILTAINDLYGMGDQAADLRSEAKN